MTRYIRILKEERLERLHKKYIDPRLLESVKKYHMDPKLNPIKTMSRSSTILPGFKGLIVNVYNGKKFIPFPVGPEHFGHKYGEYIYTRRFLGHKKQGKKLMFKKKLVSNKLPFKFINNFLNPLVLIEKKKTFKKVNLLRKEILPLTNTSVFNDIITFNFNSDETDLESEDYDFFEESDVETFNEINSNEEES